MNSMHHAICAVTQEPTTAGGDAAIASKTSEDDGELGTGASHGSETSDAKGFNYMQAEEDVRGLQAAAQQFLDGIMVESAPACKLPVMLQVLQPDAHFPSGIKARLLGCSMHHRFIQ